MPLTPKLTGSFFTTEEPAAVRLDRLKSLIEFSSLDGTIPSILESNLRTALNDIVHLLETLLTSQRSSST